MCRASEWAFPRATLFTAIYFTCCSFALKLVILVHIEIVLPEGSVYETHVPYHPGPAIPTCVALPEDKTFFGEIFPSEIDDFRIEGVMSPWSWALLDEYKMLIYLI